MITHTAIQDTADHDAVMSWLQDRELKDHKLGAARSGRARPVEIWTAIDRLRELACKAFPHIGQEEIGPWIQEYIDPFKLAHSRPR